MSAGAPGHPEDDQGEKGGVRTALAGLTTRGRSFLAAGVAGQLGFIKNNSDPNVPQPPFMRQP